MAERISREAIKREEGYLYYLGKDGYVWQNPTRANKSGRKARVGNEKVERAEGYLYYVDSDGFVSRVKQARGRKKK
ncbi:hypothetical protein M1373_02315 [Candidatus Marsarchaeota archaeon]|nr:hypothetical protein [Candidatus Marsarchaeota archaeon]MCL5404852.1 hypothetical protein [Candidatus Marsarchaeota archaeon]